MPPSPIPNAMVLATVDSRGYPSARVVLCKEIDSAAGLYPLLHQLPVAQGRRTRRPTRAPPWYFTGIIATARCAPRARWNCCPMPRTTPIFAPGLGRSRLGAWASQQSQPVESREALAAAVAREARRFGIPYEGPGSPRTREHRRGSVPRPPHWGGYRLYADAVELWVEGRVSHSRPRALHAGARGITRKSRRPLGVDPIAAVDLSCRRALYTGFFLS